MADILFYFQGSNGSMIVQQEGLVINKSVPTYIPLEEIKAVQFHEGKMFQEGYLLVTPKHEEERFIFEMMKDNEYAIMVPRRESDAAQKFADRVEEFLYEKFYG